MRRVCLIILLIMVMMLSGFTVVNADVDDSAVFSLTTTNTDVKVGDEVTINLVIDKIEGFSGINIFSGVKVFDADIFEYIGCEGQNGWELKQDFDAIVIRTTSVSSSGVIATLKFKALKPVEDAKISITEIDASYGIEGDVWSEDGNVNAPSISFKVTEAEPDPDPEPTPDPEPKPDTNKVNNDKTTAPGGSIPQTGESYTVIGLVAAVVVLAGIFYTKYKMYEEK